jgi:hypothetical protein
MIIKNMNIVNVNVVDAKVVNDSSTLLYLDAGNTASYSGTGTTWYDLSTNQNHATSLTGATYSSSNGGYFTFSSGSGTLTPSKFNTTYTGKTVFIAGNSNSFAYNNFHAALGTSNGSRNFNFYIYSAATNVYNFHMSSNGQGAISNNTSYVANNWFTAAATWTTGGTLTFYFNGQVVNTTTATFSQYVSDTNEYVAQADNNWTGALSVVSAYSRALSAAEIYSNHNAIRGRYGLS